MKIGDHIQRALELIGVTSEGVERWLGRECHCKERQEKLNQLGAWAARVLKGKTDRAQHFLKGILEVEP